MLKPSLSREVQRRALEAARCEAIECFAANLSPLLLAPPLRGTAVLGVDPGFAHGHKLAVVSAGTASVTAHARCVTPCPPCYPRLFRDTLPPLLPTPVA